MFYSGRNRHDYLRNTNLCGEFGHTARSFETKLAKGSIKTPIKGFNKDKLPVEMQALYFNLNNLELARSAALLSFTQFAPESPVSALVMLKPKLRLFSF